MKIIHLVSSIDASTGGPARSITASIQGVKSLSQYKLKLNCGHSDTPIYGILEDGHDVVDFFEFNSFGYLKGLNFGKEDVSRTILHGHGIWEMPIHQLASQARKLKIPYIISPHGMLEPWALSQGSCKKKIALRLYQMKDLKQAFCLHATSNMEANALRDLGVKNPIAIIPNSVELPNIIKSLDLNAIKSNKSHNKILFLSRIHPKKGIENLIEAWARIPGSLKNGWTLEIVGNGDPIYIQKLKNIISIKGLQHSVQILDPVYGDRKNDVYLSADFFVLPTYSENFGMVVAEAMSFGIPVITTKGAPWEELQTHNAGWWIDIGVDPLTKALSEAMITPKEKLVEMGQNGRKIIEEKYSIEKVSKQMIELYDWILNKGKKPDVVDIY